MNLKTASQSEIVAALQQVCGEVKISGDEVTGKTCPYCRKADFKFSGNIAKQVFRCRHEHSCGARGTIFKLFSDFGVLSPVSKAKSESYALPKQDKTISATDEFYQWYTRERGIDADVLKKYNVSFKQAGKKKYIVYPYIESGIEKNRKYRNCQNKKDMFTEKGAEQVYYGAQFLDFKEKRLIIVSGEDDVHALMQIGCSNVVSVPFGDQTYSPAMDRINQRFEEIILLFDGDDSGQKGAYNFASKAGFHKCRNVVLPYKDARDCMLNGIDIFQVQIEINKARPFKCREIVKTQDMAAGVIESIFSPRHSGVMLPCHELNRTLGGIRPGELTVVIAHTGSGKTTFALNVAWWCLQAGMKALVLSFEGSIYTQVNKLIEVSTGESIREYSPIENRWKITKDREWITQQINALNEQPLYFLNREAINKNGYYDIDKLSLTIEYAAKFHDVNFVVIDHLHYFLNLTAERNPVHKIDETMRKLSQITQRLNVHTMLVVHPSKIMDDKSGKLIPVGLNSAKGASSIQQEAFNFITVQKKEDKDGNYYSKVNILKNRAIGRTGEILFSVLQNLNTYRTDSMKEVKPHWSAEL
ncbi:MAG: AAA family ATPase [Chitinispirillaceae bacterium]|nr:AAA family ATPase [Chitinispirillaceae bacterium]